MKEITDKIRAQVYRELADDIDDHSLLSAENLRIRADSKDPPRPEPGTVVWWRVTADDKWHLGCVVDYGIVPADNPSACWNWDFKGLEYKPAHIPGPDEVATSRPHTDVWPIDLDGKHAKRADLVWHFIDSSGRCFNQQTAKHGSITRAEAEAMEAER